MDLNFWTLLTLLTNKVTTISNFVKKSYFSCNEKILTSLIMCMLLSLIHI